jgi:hypothetical protein
MFIQTEHTPNPATLKFIPGKTVLEEGTVDYRTKEEAAESPLASRLFEVDGVTGVFLGSDFISVTKGDAEWPHIRPAILGAIMEHYLSGAPVMSGASTAEDVADEDYDPKDEETVRTPHLPGLQGRRGVPTHAWCLCRLPELDCDVAARHREPAQALLSGRAGSPPSLAMHPGERS